MNETQTFLCDLFRDCAGYVEITILDDLHKDSAPTWEGGEKRASRTRWLPCESLADALPETLAAAQTANDAGFGVYVGGATRVAPKPKGERGTKGDTLQLPGIWADLDWGYARIFDAAARLDAFCVPPTVIVATGGGVQGWWRFTQPVPIENADSRKFWERIMQGIARSIDGDSSVADVARVMRLPGFRNMKPDRDGYMAHVFIDNFEAVAGTNRPVNPFEFAVFEGMAEPPRHEWRPRENGHHRNGKHPAMTHRAREFIQGGAVEGTRHSGLIHTAYQMREKGYEREECYAQAGNAASQSGLPENEITDVIDYVYGQ